MDGEHAFSAALVLAMSQLALRGTARDAAALRDALGILKDMALRGDSAKLRSRCALLESLMQRRGGGGAGQVEQRPAEEPRLKDEVDVVGEYGEGLRAVQVGDVGAAEGEAYPGGAAVMDDFIDFDWDLATALMGEEGMWSGGYAYLDGMDIGGLDGGDGVNGVNGMGWNFWEGM